MNSLKLGLNNLKFTNTYLNSLSIISPEDPSKSQQTPKTNYSRVNPTPLINPKLVSISKNTSQFLDLNYEFIRNDAETLNQLSGNELIKGSVPVAHCYCGHQFGNFAGQLGDGRAITLGEVKNSIDEIWELQLKGSGRTPYSRFADGRAVLRSSIREFLCSEHLFHLGIPTTRALSLISSDSKVVRDMFYDGHPVNENCAVVLRLSQTFWRFGSFEIFKDTDKFTGHSGPSVNLDKEMLPGMLDYIIKNHFPIIYQKYQEVNKLSILEFFKVLVARTAFLVANWQVYGFVHGVLNTDNMSIIGVTIDYGPYGFVEFFDKNYTPNHSDKNGRYAYQNQPKICQWNLIKLSEALNKIIPKEETHEIIVKYYYQVFYNCYYTMMRFKLGLIYLNNGEDDNKLIDDLFKLLDNYGFDLSLFLRNLSKIELDLNQDQVSDNDRDIVDTLLKFSSKYEGVLKKMRPEMNENMIERLCFIAKENPGMLINHGIDPLQIENQRTKLEEFKKFIEESRSIDEFESNKRNNLTNWLNSYKKRIKQEGLFVLDNSSFEIEKLNLTKNFLDSNFLNIQPYSINTFKDNYTKIYKEFEISLFSKNIDKFKISRIELMNSLNPRFVLRNYLAQNCIEEAEQGNFSEVDEYLEIFTSPYSKDGKIESKSLNDPTLELSQSVCLSCSS